MVLTRSGRDRQNPAWVCVREHKNATKPVKPVRSAGIFLLWLFFFFFFFSTWQRGEK